MKNLLEMTRSNLLESSYTTSKLIMWILITIFAGIFISSIIIIVIRAIKNKKLVNKYNDLVQQKIKEEADKNLQAQNHESENKTTDSAKARKIKCAYCGSKYASDNDKCPVCGAKNQE